jgi:nucleolin
VPSTSPLAAQRSAFLPLQRRFASNSNGEEDLDAIASEDAKLSEEESAAAATSSGQGPSSGGVISDAASTVGNAAAAAGASLSDAAGFSRGGRNEGAASYGKDSFGKDAPPSKTLYIGNLFFDVRGEDLKREFEAAGTVTDVRVIMDSRGLSKG